ncbi:MAG: hypothetical protein HC898_05730 [Phycisphaerales bacterium]|nr:hypothetical protein [Phycisphaerales bacterium]
MALPQHKVALRAAPEPVVLRVSKVVRRQWGHPGDGAFGRSTDGKASAGVEVVGRLIEVRRSIVAAEVVGRVVDRPVDEGDVVKGGKLYCYASIRCG